VTASDGTDCSGAFDEVTISLKVNALYIWGYYYKVLQYEDERERFFQICEAENIDTVWFQVDGDTRKFLENYPGLPKDAIPTFLQEANSMGIEVHALLGGPNSLLGKSEPLKSYVAMILKYNEEHPDARFAGIHFDIEGNDTGWTQSQLLRKWVSFMHALKTWSHKDHPGKTVVTQGLTLSLYEAYPPGYWGSTRQEWIDYVSEFDLICLQVYGFDREERMFGRPNILEKEGLPFVFLLETDELDRAHEGYTFYEEGRDAFYTARSGLDEYYSDNYGLFRGFGVHHYKRAISVWHTIETVTWPSGELRPGQKVSFPVRLRVSDDCSLKVARGIELQIRDSEGHTWKTGRIAVLPQRGSKDITLQWTVPEDAGSGSYDAKVTVYDLDWYRGTRDPLYYVYGDFVKRYHLPPIEDLTLGEFSDLVKNNSSIFYGVGRKTFVVLDYDGWRENCFTVP
jgi:hypothetical protein